MIDHTLEFIEPVERLARDDGGVPPIEQPLRGVLVDVRFFGLAERHVPGLHQPRHGVRDADVDRVGLQVGRGSARIGGRGARSEHADREGGGEEQDDDGDFAEVLSHR